MPVLHKDKIAANVKASQWLSPGWIQTWVTTLATEFSSTVGAHAKAALHAFAVAVNDLTVSQLTLADIEAILASVKVNIPPAELGIFNAIVSSVLMVLNFALAIYGSNAAEVLAYAQGIAAGILAAGY